LVVNKAGAPLADCSIGWTPVTPGLLGPEFSIRTGGGGKFEVGLSSGVWTLETLWCPGGKKGRADYVTIPDQGSVSVRIVATGAPKAKARISAKLKGRLLVATVQVKNQNPPRGKNLVSVMVKKKVIKANLNAQGKAQVRLPKAIKKGTKIKVVFLGTSDAKRTATTIRR